MPWWIPLLAFASGLIVGLFSVRRYRRDRIAWAKRRLQLLVLSLEIKSLRQKVVSAAGRSTPPAKRRLVRKLPRLEVWQKWLIAWLRRPLPWLTRFLRFSPMTYIRWLQAKGRRAHALKIAEGKRRGRPPTPPFVVEAILAIKNAHPYYSAGRIARMLCGGELKLQIAKNTVAKILKAHGFAPRPKGKQPPRESEPGWLTILYNQHVMAIDFKVTYNMTGNRLYVFNLIDHGRRILHWSRATYQPTAAWVAQQLRNAFMDLDVLPEAIVLDRDSTFLPIIKQTLPAMGIKPIRIGYKCPWQYYNTARPHMANGVEPPILPDLTDNPATNDPAFFKTPRKLERNQWLGGLHSSYRWAA